MHSVEVSHRVTMPIGHPNAYTNYERTRAFRWFESYTGEFSEHRAIVEEAVGEAIAAGESIESLAGIIEGLATFPREDVEAVKIKVWLQIPVEGTKRLVQVELSYMAERSEI